MDKEWMKIRSRSDPKYVEGLDGFLDFAFSFPATGDTIRCPCNKCRNVEFHRRGEVRFHLLRDGIMPNYTTWHLHGEVVDIIEDEDEVDLLNVSERDTDVDFDNIRDEEMINMLKDVCGVPEMEFEVDDGTFERVLDEEPSLEAKNFFRLVKDSQKPLYPNAKISKLSFIVKALQLKCEHNWTDVSFDSYLKFQKEILPDGALVPESYYQAKKLFSDLGFDYIKIDACNNDCIIYWGENAKSESCPVCGLSRWKRVKGSANQKNIPHKVRYFPLKPRMQRLFMSRKIARYMRWHKEDKPSDGVMRHPADSQTWKSFDEEYKSFSSDPRSVRLGLAHDGFNPFGHFGAAHSCWPVVLMPYNLPPWMCMKPPFLMLTLLIPGNPRMNIDVYLQPLIADLKELWEVGVETYDAHSRQTFTMHASVLWTINDFPAYGFISGWSTKGYLSCPSCNENVHSHALKGSKKICYMGHRRWLPPNHPWRRNALAFDGTREKGSAPIHLDGEDVLNKLNSVNRSKSKCRHRTGNLTFTEFEEILTKENGGVKPVADEIWFREHAKYNKETKEWEYSREDLGSKKVFEDLHLLVEKSLEGERHMTQEEMLLEVFPPRSGYFRGKGNGYKGYSKRAAAAAEYQQRRHQKILELEKQVEELKVQSQRQEDNHKQALESLREEFLQMFARKNNEASISRSWHEDVEDWTDEQY